MTESAEFFGMHGSTASPIVRRSKGCFFLFPTQWTRRGLVFVWDMITDAAMGQHDAADVTQKTELERKKQMTNRTNETGFFFAVFAWVLLGIIVTGFGGKAVFDTENLPPLTALHHAHAIAMLCWFTLFAVQPTLIRRGNVGLHRRLGTLSLIFVLVFISLAIAVMQLNWERVGEPIIVTANAVNLTLFLILYSGAIAWRRNGRVHKRLMIYAALMLIGPALGRFADLLGQPPETVAPVIVLLLLTPVARDLLVRRRPHPATLVGFGLGVVSIPLILGLSGSADWAAYLERVLGPSDARP